MAGYILFIILSAFIALFLITLPGKYLGYKAGLYAIIASAAAGILVFILYWNTPILNYSFSWFQAGDLQLDFDIILDSVALMMISLISFIGGLVYLFSIPYLEGNEGLRRYFILLVLFQLSMYGLVLSANLFQLFFFWELVGFCSYGLIGFYYQKPYAAKAAGKAFMINRVADVFIVIGLGLIFQQFGSLSIATILDEGTISIVAGICLLIGASGKSAQYPFAIWLPDAMAGPTPVSAFIHAATMVTAGIILIVRVYFLLPEEVLIIMAFLGAVTAALAALVALVQHDIKKVLAYSTISQLGYMFAGLGTGAWDASLFHLFTHAFFKAGLFLNAGAVILWLTKVQKQNKIEFDVQDMRVMGGLRKNLPFVFISFTLCSLALIGVPFFSGYLSKDAIISGAWAWAAGKDSILYYIVPDLTFLTIILTAIYMIRIWSLIFLGDLKLKKLFPVQNYNTGIETLGIKISVMLLGLLSLGFIVSMNPLDIEQNWVMPGIRNYLAFDKGVDTAILKTKNHLLVAGISILLILAGATYAWLRYRPYGKYHSSYSTHEFRAGYLKIAFHHYYLDTAFMAMVAIFVRFGKLLYTIENKVIDNIINKFAIVNVVLAHIIKWVDKYIVDGLVNFSALLAAFAGRRVRLLSSGKIQGQIVAALALFLILLMIIMF